MLGDAVRAAVGDVDGLAEGRGLGLTDGGGAVADGVEVTKGFALIEGSAEGCREGCAVGFETG